MTKMFGSEAGPGKRKPPPRPLPAKRKKLTVTVGVISDEEAAREIANGTPVITIDPIPEPSRKKRRK